ncbi:MAG TPA: fibronectin type III domain-containing protein [Kribbella sp.]|nr:fibronectin type III domain-containing protein [Kribbella sp.]
MQVSIDNQRNQAQAAAAAWWADKPFPVAPWGRPYVCDVCGAVISAREGTSLVGMRLHCAACTDRLFPREAPPIPTTGQSAAPPTTAPPYWRTPLPPPEPEPGAHGRRRAFVIAGTAVAAVIALVGVLLWAPWAAAPTPNAPTGLYGVAATATTISIGWTASAGEPKPDRYVIERNGNDVATVDSSTTSYRDQGLAPGLEYRYAVVAETGKQRSDPSDVLVATTSAPGPVALRAGKATTTSLSFSWSAPPDSPAPDEYIVVRSGITIATIPGTTRSYSDTGLTAATTYRYQVFAVWSGRRSKSSDLLSMATNRPPIASARLQGSFPMRFTVVSSGGGSLSPGDSWINAWSFSPKCAAGPCAVTAAGVVAPGGYTQHDFKVTLNRSGTTYTGKGKAHITHCGQAPLVVAVTDTVTVRLTARSGRMSGETWVVDSLTGTMTIASPYTTAGAYFCPAQSVKVNISGQ